MEVLFSVPPQAFVATGTNLSLQFFPANLHGDQRQLPAREYVDFERETGKVGQDTHTHTHMLCIVVAALHLLITGHELSCEIEICFCLSH